MSQDAKFSKEEEREIALEQEAECRAKSKREEIDEEINKLQAEIAEKTRDMQETNDEDRRDYVEEIRKLQAKIAEKDRRMQEDIKPFDPEKEYYDERDRLNETAEVSFKRLDGAPPLGVDGKPDAEGFYPLGKAGNFKVTPLSDVEFKMTPLIDIETPSGLPPEVVDLVQEMQDSEAKNAENFDGVLEEFGTAVDRLGDQGDQKAHDDRAFKDLMGDSESHEDDSASEVRLELSEEQQVAADAILSWASGRWGEFSLGGYAGTGKTTLLNYIRNALEESGTAVVLAPTGKAAQVLRSKGVPAETVHSYFYRFLGVERNVDGEEVPQFMARAGLEQRPDWVIIDESSMINRYVAEDIRKHRLPILWVGDHGQLPPIGPDPGVMKNPDAVLETIHRQAFGNPIIKAAHSVRKGQTPSRWLCGNSSRTSSSPDGGKIHIWKVTGDESTIVDYAIKEEVDQIICGKNRTRHTLNRIYRERTGRQFPDNVEVGDKVICLRNNRRRMVFNGQTFQVDRIVDYWPGAKGPNGLNRNLDIVLLDLSTDTGRKIDLVPCWAGQWLSNSKLTDEEAEELADMHVDRLEELPISSIEYFDFGYAITCHKSQGSEWPRVLVVDEGFGDKARWRYTAITRARDFCAVATY